MGLNRRAFLKYLGGVFLSLPFLDLLQKERPKISKVCPEDTGLLRGEFGAWNNVTIHRHQRVWAESLWRESQRPSFFAQFQAQEKNPCRIRAKVSPDLKSVNLWIEEK